MLFFCIRRPSFSLSSHHFCDCCRRRRDYLQCTVYISDVMYKITKQRKLYKHFNKEKRKRKISSLKKISLVRFHVWQVRWGKKRIHASQALNLKSVLTLLSCNCFFIIIKDMSNCTQAAQPCHILSFTAEVTNSHIIFIYSISTCWRSRKVNKPYTQTWASR